MNRIMNAVRTLMPTSRKANGRSTIVSALQTKRARKQFDRDAGLSFALLSMRANSLM